MTIPMLTIGWKDSKPVHMLSTGTGKLFSPGYNGTGQHIRTVENDELKRQPERLLL